MLTALWIVLLGMAVIFAVLAVLLVVMLLLRRLLRPRASEAEQDKQ
jgi:Na+-transporting methylmalonyl-CoA/oxaloacetate decarboxylase gamma subunit